MRIVHSWSILTHFYSHSNILSQALLAHFGFEGMLLYAMLIFYFVTSFLQKFFFFLFFLSLGFSEFGSTNCLHLSHYSNQMCDFLRFCISLQMQGVPVLAVGVLGKEYCALKTLDCSCVLRGQAGQREQPSFLPTPITACNRQQPLHIPAQKMRSSLLHIFCPKTPHHFQRPEPVTPNSLYMQQLHEHQRSASIAARITPNSLTPRETYFLQAALELMPIQERQVCFRPVIWAPKAPPMSNSS